MSDKNSSVVDDRSDHGQNTTCQAREHALNAAILRADITRNLEQYLDIFDVFYANDVEVNSEPQEQPIRGRERVRVFLADFLIPIHRMAEIGGLVISVQEAPILGALADETRSLWTLEVAGVFVRTCTLSWHVARKWKGPYIVSEHHYDHRQTGGPLTSVDLSWNGSALLQLFQDPHAEVSAQPVKQQSVLRDRRT